MKTKLVLSILLPACITSHAQNLVPNPDFELTNQIFCSWTFSAADFDSSTVFWNSPTNGTPDIHSTLIQNNCPLFHPNSTYFGCVNGSQMPHSGNIFAGYYPRCADFTITGYREYLQVRLTSPMVPGTVYAVELYVSLGDNSHYATNNFGIGFSTSYTFVNTQFALGYTPRKNFTQVITDTINWVQLKDTILAIQPYEYIIIGNFFNDANTTMISVDSTACFDRTYYYVDDVSIYVDSTVSIQEAQLNKDMIVYTYPNPFSGALNIKINSSQPSEIILSDMVSRQVLREKLTNSVSINTEHLSKGVYVYEIRNEQGIIRKGKVVKE